jgi:hypothetical protein
MLYAARMELMQRRLRELRTAHRHLLECDGRLMEAVKARDVPNIAKAIEERDRLYPLWEAVFLACEEELKRLADLNSPVQTKPEPKPAPSTRPDARRP